MYKGKRRDILLLARRLDAEEDGRWRPFVDCPELCCAREDCGRATAPGPGLAALRTAFDAPARGAGASTGEFAAEVPVLFLHFG